MALRSAEELSNNKQHGLFFKNDDLDSALTEVQGLTKIKERTSSRTHLSKLWMNNFGSRLGSKDEERTREAKKD